MKKHLLIIFLLIINCIAILAQDSYIKARWNIKAGYTQYPGLPLAWHGIEDSYGNLRMEADYGILKFLEFGGYLGYSRILSTNLAVAEVGEQVLFKKLNTPFFGINVNFHPLTFLIHQPDFRFDVYLLARYAGLFYTSSNDYIPKRGFGFLYEHGAGLSFYLTKHIGIFGEYSYSVLRDSFRNLRYGLSVKW